MKRKRINHQVDIFCDMFSGWKLVNDMNTLVQLQAGQFAFDFLSMRVKLNDNLFDRDFHMLFEIAGWFEKDLTDNKIEKISIHGATLIVDFIVKVTEGKHASRTKKIIEIKLNMKSSILTDEKEYSANRERIMEYHCIGNKYSYDE